MLHRRFNLKNPPARRVFSCPQGRGALKKALNPSSGTTMARGDTGRHTATRGAIPRAVSSPIAATKDGVIPRVGELHSHALVSSRWLLSYLHAGTDRSGSLRCRAADQPDRRRRCRHLRPRARAHARPCGDTRATIAVTSRGRSPNVTPCSSVRHESNGSAELQLQVPEQTPWRRWSPGS
jgi:hypothetical protein